MLSFYGSWVVTQFLLGGWHLRQAQLAGIALSTASVAVGYAVMIESGLNEGPLGKFILSAYFVTDLGTVIALGLLFAEMGFYFWLFAAVTLVLLSILSPTTKKYYALVKNHPSKLEVKFIFVILSALVFHGVKGGSEAVLPAYLVGAVLANLFLKNSEPVRRLGATTNVF